MSALLIIGAAAVIAVALWITFAPNMRARSLAEEERMLREHCRKRDEAERRGEIYPP